MVQIPGDVDSVPQDKIHIVRNMNPEYRRDPGASQDLALAVILTQAMWRFLTT